MAATEHKFRYLLKPGSNFQFVAKFRTWLILSLVLCAASVGALFMNKSIHGEYMNWTVDFRGGTEITYAFRDKADSSKYVKVDIGQVRSALREIGGGDVEISDLSWEEKVPGQDEPIKVPGILLRTARFGGVTDEQSKKAIALIQERLASRQIEKMSWSSDRLFIRSKALVSEADVQPILTDAGLELKAWTPEETKLFTTPDEGTLEYRTEFAVWGLDRQYARELGKSFTNVEIQVLKSYGVGAKAGDRLRSDAIKSMFYAMFLITLYLAFRFDIRYAPGAVVATFHDAIMVIGIFAVTWTPVSLTSVAALLTVVGYSVNDTVIIFDRIRENSFKFKDKKLERIVDLSLNETLVRSILTSLTVFAVTLIMNIFGDGLVSNFAFAMNIGVIVGSYSSLFLAPPVFLWIQHRWYSGPASSRHLRTAEQIAEEP